MMVNMLHFVPVKGTCARIYLSEPILFYFLWLHVFSSNFEVTKPANFAMAFIAFVNYIHILILRCLAGWSVTEDCWLGLHPGKLSYWFHFNVIILDAVSLFPEH